MGLFNFLKKEKIENENKTKPFHENTNTAEQKDWFSRTRGWHKVDTEIIDALIEKYNEDPIFEVFVFTSMENNLVKEYQDININGLNTEVACSIISGILFKHGENASTQVLNMFNNDNINDDKLSKLYGNAMNLLESAISTDSNQINAYISLAMLREIVGNDDDALNFVQQGLKKIKQIKDKDIPFHKSTISGIQNTAKYLNDAEKQLSEMENKLS